MKILMLTIDFVPDVEYQENLLLKAYYKLGHEVHIIASTRTSLADIVDDRYDRNAPGSISSLGGATIYRMPWAVNFFNRIHRYADILPILERVHPDLIFVHSVMMNLPDCIRYIRKHPDCKMILDFHGDYTNSGSNWLSLRILHGVVRKWVLNRARPYLSKIFPITPGSQKFLREIYNIPENEMEILPLGADLDTCRQVRASSARRDLRAAHNIDDDRVVVFTGGKLWPGRQTEALIESVKALPQDKVYLVIIGDSTPIHREYRKMLDGLAIGYDNIRFTGWLGVEDVFRYMAMADIAAFPASQSILWQQCIGMGLPLVIGDPARGVQDISYLNLHGNVLIAAEGQPLEIALRSILEKLIADPVLRKEMAEGADKTAAKILDWSALANRTLRFNHAEA